MDITVIFSVRCLASDWDMWSQAHAENAFRSPITDPALIVDAIVHCIDRASGRQAIHDPETFNQLERDINRYEKMIKDGANNMEDSLKWGSLVEEMKKRKEMRQKLRVIG